MKKLGVKRDIETSWLEEIKAKYNVDHEDFTTKYPDGIIVYKASTLPPEVVFAEGFRRSADPIWIEDSRYLLGEKKQARRYIQDQKKLNKALIEDYDDQEIMFPGETQGLISTTFSAKKATWDVSDAYLDTAESEAYARYDNIDDNTIKVSMCRAFLDGYFRRTCEVKEPIGYIYALRITQGINISAHFQWANLANKNLIGQEIACLEIPGTDILYARAIYMTLAHDHRLVCSPGPIKQNHTIADKLQPVLESSFDKNELLEIGFDQELQYFRSNQTGRVLVFNQLLDEFLFSYHSEKGISLEDGNFSKFYIMPHIPKTQSSYLTKLRERLDGTEANPKDLKRLKQDGKITVEKYQLRFTESFSDRKDSEDSDKPHTTDLIKK